MISYLGEWIQHIVLIILVATFLDLLLPNSQMRRYIKLVVGLLIMMTILSPVLNILSYDHEKMLREMEQMFEEPPRSTVDLERQREELEEQQNEAILDEVERLWSYEMMTDLEARFPVVVTQLDVDLALDGDQPYLNHLLLEVEGEDRKREPEHLADENGGESGRTVAEGSDGRIQIERIQVKPVMINLVDPDSDDSARSVSAMEKGLEEKLLTYLEGEWNIPRDKIEFFWTGR